MRPSQATTAFPALPSDLPKPLPFGRGFNCLSGREEALVLGSLGPQARRAQKGLTEPSQYHPPPPRSAALRRRPPPPLGPQDCALGRRARPGEPIIRSPGTHSPGALQSNRPHVSSSVSPRCPSSPRWPRGSHRSRSAQTLTPAGAGSVSLEPRPPPSPSSIPEPRSQPPGGAA